MLEPRPSSNAAPDTRSSGSLEDNSNPVDVIEVEDFSFSYDRGKTLSLENITLAIPEKSVTAFIGPSGSGKSTMLRCITRMNDSIPGSRVCNGGIRIKGSNVYSPTVAPKSIRTDVGILLQTTRPLPGSIFSNIAYGLRARRTGGEHDLDSTVEKSLRDTGLWNEVKDFLKVKSPKLSRSQQQRLCISRVLATAPSIFLLDDPCANLSSVETSEIEHLFTQLCEEVTLVVTTPNVQQATRIADRTAFFHLGKLIEFDLTSKVFTNPTEKKTEEYISGRFG